MPERCIPIARLTVFDKGAEGYVTDPGWAWHSAMAADWEEWWDYLGYPYGSAIGTPPGPAFMSLELGAYSLSIPTPYHYPWHTELAQWTQNVGTWEERPLWFGGGDGAAPLTGLWCIDTYGQIESAFYHPAAPNFVLSFGAMPAPHDYDLEAYPPYLSIFWGPPAPAGAEVAYELHITHDGEAYIGTWVAGGVVTYAGIGNIGWDYPRKGDGWKSLTIMIMHIAGGIGIRPSSGGGRWFFFQGDGDIWPDAGGQITVEYSGGQAIVGLHGIVGPDPVIASGSTTNYYTSPIRNADRVRAGHPTTYGRYWVPVLVGANVDPDLSIADIDHTGTDEVELEVETIWGYDTAYDGMGDLAPQANLPMSYKFPYFPELYAAGAYFGPVVQAPSAGETEYYSHMINSIDLVENDEADVSHAELDVVWDAGDLGGFADYLFMRWVKLELGWHYDDDTDGLAVMLTGYVTRSEAEQVPGRPNLLRVRATIADATTRTRQIECDESWPVMDGWDAEVALLVAAAKCGWHSTACVFASCSGWNLSWGRPEEPLWQAQPGQLVWEFMERVARYCGQELAILRSGVIGSRVICYVDTGTVHNIVGATSALAAAARRRNAFSYTGVEVHGRTATGEPLTCWLADTDCESNPASDYFRGFRRLERFEDAGWTTQADCDDLATIFWDTMSFRNPDIFTWRTVAYETALRRDTAYISGLTIGITVAHRLALVGLKHHWGPRKPDCYTEWGAVYYPV